jgi:type II secretory pathway component PulF
MSIWLSLKSINRHGTACAVLALLLLLGAAVHTIAVAKIALLSDIPLTTWPPRLARNMTGIQFFHDNWWFALPYLLLFFGTLIYMEIRSMPRWAVWATFLFLSLPIVGYFLTCMRLGACSILVMGPIHGP